MKKIKTVALIGLGAIGAAYGSRLNTLTNASLQVILDEERVSRYQGRAYLINSEPCQFQYVSAQAKAEPVDLIIVAVKYNNLPEAIEAMGNFVGPDTTILSLLNGISSEEKIGAVYGMEKVLYGICVGIDAVRVAGDVQFSNIGKIVFGAKENKDIHPRVQGVMDLFAEAGIEYQVPEDMLKSLWWKFMVNVGVNQTSAMLKAPYGVFQEVKEARELMELAMKEVIAIAKAKGINLSEADIETFHEILSTLSPLGKTSMLQDVEAGRKTEVEMLAGQVCELGKGFSIPTPVNELLLKVIRVLEQRGNK